ncbi:ROK family protein [Amycolatopsis sp. NPDC049868]|uniref:ROK family transcriptional regulator n=1 Tax=Amycolatopsis sp. NPDC049868 TaxID=3363934 RepID=UPI0037A07AC1
MADSTVRSLRKRTRSSVLATLYFEGPLSQRELQAKTGLSAPTISNVIAELMTELIVEETGITRPTGGRPRVMLRVNPGYAHFAGVDINSTGTRVRVTLSDLGRNQLSAIERPISTRSNGPSKVAKLIASCLREVHKRARVSSRSIVGVGVGVPGFVDPRQEPRVFSSALDWDDVRLTGLLRSEGIAWPLFLSSRTEALGRAEMLYGAARGSRNSLVVSVDSTIDAAFMIAGSTEHDSSITDWGHSTLVYNGKKCECGSRGCLQTYASATGILAEFHNFGHETKADCSDKARFETLIKMANKSPSASRILTAGVRHLGAGIGSLVTILKPEQVILSGWAGLLIGNRFMPEIRAASASHALHYAFERTSFDLGLVGVDDTNTGTTTLPIMAFLELGSLSQT